MTDGEPEPFRMPMDPDDGDVEHTQPTEDDDTQDDAASSPLGGESIADLINEASRTAAEQAEREAAGEVPRDRSADVWGEQEQEAGGGDDAAAVWAGEEQGDSAAVWALDDEGDDAGWGSIGTADPDPATHASHARSTPPASPAAADDPAHAAPDEDEPETFTFDVGAATPSTPSPQPSSPVTPHTQHDPVDDAEPETFTFEAGPESSAPMPTGTTDAVEAEPDTFTFSVDDEAAPTAAPADDVAEPEGATVEVPPPATGSTDDGDVHEEEDSEWTDPGADGADGEPEPDTDVWTFDVQDLQEQDEQPLAESVAPRDDTGWRDLDAEQEPTWSVSDLPARAHDGGEEEPEGFAASLDDAPVDNDPPPADVVAAEVHDALDDLLGNDEADSITASATPAAADDTPSPSSSGLDQMDDLDDLEHLDALDDLSAPTDLTASDQPDDAEADDADEPLDAATAARQVMEPGSVTFSSSGKKKKRGLFG